jgi:hypothetical protein
MWHLVKFNTTGNKVELCIDDAKLFKYYFPGGCFSTGEALFN